MTKAKTPERQGKRFFRLCGFCHIILTTSLCHYNIRDFRTQVKLGITYRARWESNPRKRMVEGSLSALPAHLPQERGIG